MNRSIQIPRLYLGVSVVATLLIASAVVWPLVVAADGAFLRHPHFVEYKYGHSLFANFRYLFESAEVPSLPYATIRSAVYALVTSASQVSAGAVIALFLFEILSNRSERINQLTKALILGPYVLLTVVTVEFCIHASDKILAFMDFRSVGENQLANAFLLFMVSVWQFVPMPVILLLGALEGIPKEQRYVFQVETSRYADRLRYLLLPAMYQILVAVFVLRFLWMFTKFETPYFVTDGPLRNPSMLLAVYINVFRFDSTATTASASYWKAGSSVVLMLLVEFLLLASFALFFYRKNKWRYYDAM